MDSLKKDIREEYERHGSLFKTAKALGVKVDYVAGVIGDETPVDTAPDTSSCAFDGFGDPEKKKFLAARSLATESWDNSLHEVSQARRKFEEGTHGLNIGRDGPWLLLYSIPQAVKTPRPNYFAHTVEG